MNITLKGADILRLCDMSAEQVLGILDSAKLLKTQRADGTIKPVLSGKHIGIIMQKPSLRTRVSFEVACHLLGAYPVVLEGATNAFSRGESVQDTVGTLEGYLDALVVRTFEDAFLAQIADDASIPVVNALTDGFHPCQGLADLLTIQEHFGTLAGITVAYVGDGSNNMAHTYLEACALMGMHLRIATPASYQPDGAILADAQRLASASGATIQITADPYQAVHGADVVITDTWASMGSEDEYEQRLADLADYQVNPSSMAHASDTAIFMHCLPAHRGEEVTDEVIDSDASKVMAEAHNRLYVQTALLQALLGD